MKQPTPKTLSRAAHNANLHDSPVVVWNTLSQFFVNLFRPRSIVGPGASSAPTARQRTPTTREGRGYASSRPLREKSKFPQRSNGGVMKKFASAGALLFVLLWLTPAVHAQSTVQPGTQVRLTLVNGLTTSVAHDGDPFTAIVAEPVFIGNQLLIPAGAKIHGTVPGVTRPKWFGRIRGGASINLVFNSMEVESRIFPIQMSILS